MRLGAKFASGLWKPYGYEAATVRRSDESGGELTVPG